MTLFIRNYTRFSYHNWSIDLGNLRCNSIIALCMSLIIRHSVKVMVANAFRLPAQRKIGNPRKITRGGLRKDPMEFLEIRCSGPLPLL